jgi:hypothetical protein
MISLTYMSTAAAPFDPAALEDLLRVSRRNNAEAGLTGMLLYLDGHFIQTLEGEAEAVDAKYELISLDPRHRSVFVAMRRTIHERAFPDWTMGFEAYDATRAAGLPGFSDFLAAKSEQDRQRTVAHLGEAGIFHRIFRDQMRGNGRPL